MSITSAFYEAVKNSDIASVRIMMKNSLLLDLSFRDFEQMKCEAASMEGLYDEHDGRELILDKTLWNDDYMNQLMAQLMMNFSHERLDHLQEVVRYLRPVQEKLNTSSDTDRKYSWGDESSEYQKGKRRDWENGDITHTEQSSVEKAFEKGKDWITNVLHKPKKSVHDSANNAVKKDRSVNNKNI